MDLRCQEPQETNSKLLDKSLTILVMLLRTFSEVAFTINLNRKFQRWTIEINDVWTYAILPSENLQLSTCLSLIPDQRIASACGIFLRRCLRFCFSDALL